MQQFVGEGVGEVIQCVLRGFPLCQKLGSARQYGIARDNEELELGVRCIAAGIFDDTGKLVAGLSISAPAERLQDDWIKALVDTAASISEALGYEPSVSTGFNGLGMAAEALRP